MSSRGSASAVLLLVAACGGPVGAADEEFDRGGMVAAREAIEGAIARGEIPGAVLLVGRGERHLLREAYGRRALAPASEPMTVDTVFDLASLTKVVATATSVMKLVELGRLRLDGPVSEHLPEFGANGKGAITVEHLLLHRSGLLPDNPLADYEGTPAQAWEAICALAPESPPGTAFVYSDVGYIVLGELLRRVDGRALDAFAREEFFEPLSLEHTTFCPGPELIGRCAPTEQREGRWMRGEVHDPRAFALGGVAGHAGLFSTADDLGRWCRMVLGGGALGGRRVLGAQTVAEMTRPRWLPDGTGGRSLGFDVDSVYSSARGDVFPRGASFGHTGFTGTSLWLDPESRSYVILLTNRVHPDGSGKVVGLRRAVASAAASAVGMALRGPPPEPAVLTGADVLAAETCARLVGRRVGLVTNATGATRDGRRTVDVLFEAEGVQLAALFAPEHGPSASLEGELEHGVDGATGLPLYSLYGETRRPTGPMLEGLEVLVFDLQDVGVRFYTYPSTLLYAMQAAAEHGVAVLVLDRPNPIAPLGVRGPCADGSRLSSISPSPIPLVHGMTLGELARFFAGEHGIDCELEVVPCRGWSRDMWWEDTGLPWIAPSPNLRNPTQALLYPAIGLLEGANLSVGRGTDEPFERLGAPWIDGVRLAAALNRAPIAGLAFTPIEFTPDAGPHEGEVCGGVHVALTDRRAYRPVRAGLAIGWHLGRLFSRELAVERMDARLLHRATWEAWMTSDDPRQLPALWREELAAFEQRRRPYLLYE